MKFRSTWILFMPFAVIFLLYMLGLFLPLHFTPHYRNYASRLWNWTEILIALTSVYYIIRSKDFNPNQVIISILLGSVCLVSLFRDSRTIDIIITSICTAVTFYGGCRIFDKLDVTNNSVNVSATDGMKFFLIGAAVSVPLAFLNVVFFSLQGQAVINDILFSAAYALKPAVAEEVIFRYFLFAYTCRLLRGKVSERFFTVYVYIMMVVPHDLLHSPDLFLASPINASIMSVLSSVLFGFPMALLMKRKNLQAAIGFHWFVDFVRFAAGF